MTERDAPDQSSETARAEVVAPSSTPRSDHAVGAAEGVLSLQQMAGNRATASLMDLGTADAPPPEVPGGDISALVTRQLRNRLSAARAPQPSDGSSVIRRSSDDGPVAKSWTPAGGSKIGLGAGSGLLRRAPVGAGIVQRETQTFTDDDGNVTQNPNISSTEELLEDAARVEGKFADILMTIAGLTGADVEEHEVTKKAKVQVKDADTGKMVDKKDPDTGKSIDKKTQSGRQIYTQKEEVLTGAAPLKGAARIEQKLEQKYEHKHERILDVVRGTLAYADPGELADALEKLKEFCSGRDDLAIVRCKQLFQVKGKKSKSAKKKKGSQTKLDKKLAAANVGPSAAVYGDVKVSLSVDDHVCELQFNLVPMLEAKGTKAGHGAYEAMRTLETEWVKAHKGDKAMPDLDTLHKMADEDHPDVRKIKGALQQAIKSSQAAYGDAYNEIKKHEDFDRMIETAKTLA